MTTNSYVAFDQILKEDHSDNPESGVEWSNLSLAREVSHWLILYRDSEHLSQSALGKHIGVSQQAIARLESGEITPTIETLRLLCKKLNRTITIKIQPNDWAVNISSF